MAEELALLDLNGILTNGTDFDTVRPRWTAQVLGYTRSDFPLEYLQQWEGVYRAATLQRDHTPWYWHQCAELLEIEVNGADTTRFDEAFSLNETLAYEEVPEDLAYLQGLGIRRAVLSNYPNEWTDGAISHLGLGGLVGPVFDSARLEVRKPDPEAYLRPLERLAIAAENAIYAGDSVEDLDKARDLGLMTAFMKGEDTHNGGHPEITRLSQIPEVMQSYR